MAIALASVLFIPLSHAGEKPPENAKPLSVIIKMLEDNGYHPITDIEIDQGRWEIEAYKDKMKRKLKVDAVTAKIISDRRDD